MGFASTTLADLNTNILNATTSSFDVKSQTSIAWCIINKTGSHDNHKILLQFSLDNISWVNSNHSLEGVGALSTQQDIITGYIRFKVSKVEGSTSTVDIGINAK